MNTLSTLLKFKRQSRFLILSFMAMMSLPYAAIHAQVNFTPRISQNSTDGIYHIKGDFAIIGNTNLTLTNYADGTANGNNAMRYVNVDETLNPYLFNSSSATLQFSNENNANANCTKVVYAGLYWTGRTAGGTGARTTNTFDVTKTIQGGAVSVDNNQTLTNTNGVITYTGYTMGMSRQGTDYQMDVVRATEVNTVYTMTVTTANGGNDNNTYVRYRFIPQNSSIVNEFWLEFRGEGNGNNGYAIYYSTDGTNWGSALTGVTITPASGNNPKVATFSPARRINVGNGNYVDITLLNRPQTPAATGSTVTLSYNGGTSQTITHNGTVALPAQYYPRYVFSGIGATTTWVEFLNNNTLRYSINSGGVWTTIPATVNVVGNTATATISPVFTLPATGVNSIRLSQLVRDDRSNLTESEYQNSSSAMISLNGVAASSVGNASNIFTDYYPRYTFTGAALPTIWVEFRNDNLVYSTNNGTTWANVPTGVQQVNSNKRTAPINPAFTIYTGNGMTINLTELARYTGINGTVADYTNTTNNTATVHVFGTSTQPIPYTKTLRKDVVMLRHATQTDYFSVQAPAANFTQSIYYPTTGANNDIYAAYADVTEYVKTYGAGEYFVADMALTTGTGDGTGYMGGWGMVIVYENSQMKWRDITVFDGARNMSGSGTQDLPLSGFHAVQQGDVNVKLGVMASEGDRAYAGDYFSIVRRGTTTFDPLSHGPNSLTNNFFVSAINTGGNPRNPNLSNNTGLDIAMFNIPNASKQYITNDQTSTTFRFGSTQDVYTIFSMVVGIDAYIPEPETQNVIYELTKKDGTKIEPVNGQYTAEPGTKINYKLQIRNKGTEGIDNLRIKIPVPYTTEWVMDTVRTFDGFQSNQAVFDRAAGATGEINWEVGNLPAPISGDPEHTFAELEFELVVTEDCEVLVASGGCNPSVVIDGTSSGVGSTTGITFSGMKFIYGFQSGECDQEPITTAPTISINAGTLCEGQSDTRTIKVCYTTPSATVPFAAVSSVFQPATRFYDRIDDGTGKPPVDAVEYTVSTNFPAIENVTYYAVPNTLNTNCYWKFVIDTMRTPSFNTANTQICAGDSVNLKTLVSNISPVNSVVGFYSNAGATTGIDTLVRPGVTTPYYVQSFLSGYGCNSVIGTINVAVNPRAATATITANDVAICSDNAATLTASASAVNVPVFRWYKDTISTTPVAIGASFQTGALTTAITHDTVFYVSVSGTNYCENLPAARKAVKVNIQARQTVDISAQGDINNVCHNRTIDLSVGVPGAIWIGWYDKNGALVEGATTQFSPSAINTNPDALGIDTVTYNPAALEAGSTVRLFVRVNTGICGYISDTVWLNIQPLPTVAAFELITQPLGKQELCEDTIYEVKVKSASLGTLEDIIVRLHDNHATGLTIGDAYVKHPYNTGTFEPLTVYSQDATGVRWKLPDPLAANDSVLVRMNVRAECGFFGGSSMLLQLNAESSCDEKLDSLVLETLPFETKQDTSKMNKYIVSSTFRTDAFNPIARVTNHTGDTVTWRIKAIVDGDWATDSEKEFLAALIPEGLIPIEGTYKNIWNAPENEEDLDIIDDEYGREYSFSLPDAITKGDSIVAEFSFLTIGASCGSYNFYAEVIYTDTARCESSGLSCSVYLTRGENRPSLSVDRYVFTTDSVEGRVLNGLWFGQIFVHANTEFYAGDSVHIDVYIDRDNSNTLNAGDTLVNKHTYVTQDLPAGSKFIDSLNGIYFEAGKQLLIKINRGNYLCDSLLAPTATLMGRDTVCQLDTVTYQTAAVTLGQGGSFSWGFVNLDGVSGATPLYIGELNAPTIKVVWQKQGNFEIRAQYNIDLNTKSGDVFFPVRVNPVPVLQLSGIADTTICQGSSVELSHFFHDTANIANTTISYYTKASNGSLTFLSDQKPLYVEPWDTTTYVAIAQCVETGCQARDTMNFRVNVNKSPIIGTTRSVTQPTCGQSNGAIRMAVYGGSGKYQYSLDGTNYENFPVDSTLRNLAAKTYQIYVRDTMNKVCPASTSEYITLSPINGIYATATATQVSSCSETNGTITVVANGGLAPYQYSLDGGAYTNLPVDGIIGTTFAPQAYNVTIRDDRGCVAAANAAIVGVQNGITLTLTEVAKATCTSQGLVRMIAGGGVEPFEYRVEGRGWLSMNTIDTLRLPAGRYKIAVRDVNGCETENNVIVSNENSLSASVTAIKASCNGKTPGSITLTVAGGKPPYTYSLNGGGSKSNLSVNPLTINGLTVGSYTILVTDANGCEYTLSQNITTENTFVQAVDNHFYTYKNQVLKGYVFYNNFEEYNKRITMVSRYDNTINGNIEFIFDNGHFTYMPYHDFIGKDSVRFVIQNPCGMQDSAWLHIIVLDLTTEEGKNPIALDDEYLIPMGGQLNNFEVRVNDYAPDGGSLKNPVQLTAVKNGTLTQNGNGTFNYVPNPNFVGEEIFTYRVCDDDDSCATAQVHIDVYLMSIYNTEVIAEDDGYTMQKYDTLRITTMETGVLENDHYLDGTTPVVTLVDSTENGTITINSTDGTFTYIPNLHYSGPDYFVYSLCSDPSSTCDTALVYIFINERNCPDPVTLEIRDTSICDGQVVNLNDLILPTSQNIDTVYFYNDRGLTDRRVDPVITGQGWYYIQADNIHQCSVYDSVHVISNPLATPAEITANNANICTDSVAELTAVASTAILNPAYRWYTDTVTTTPLATTANYTTGSLVTSVTKDTVFYVAVFGDNYCENLPGQRKPVKVTINQMPVVTISRLSDTLIVCHNQMVSLAASSSGSQWIGWYFNDLSIRAEDQTRFTPPSYVNFPANGRDTVDFDPLLSEAGTVQKIIVRSSVNYPVCPYVSDSIYVRILPLPTNMGLEIVAQPTDLQDVCADTFYVVKVKATQEGNLSNVRLTLNDWNNTGLSIRDSVEIMYPVSSGTWAKVDTIRAITVGKSWKVSDNLLAGDSLLVKVSVRADCENVAGFYGGSSLRFLLDARSVCNDSIPRKDAVTLDYNLKQDAQNRNSYEVFTQFFDSERNEIKTVKNNLSNDTVIWRLKAWFKGDIKAPTDSSTEEINISIPNGLNLVYGAYTPIKNALDITHVEFYPQGDALNISIPVYPNLTQETDTMIAELKFTTGTAPCKQYDFYAEVDYLDSLSCGETKCSFGFTRGIYESVLDVQRYLFANSTTDTAFGTVKMNGLWTGDYTGVAQTDFYAGDTIHLSFYIDRNNDNVIDVGDTLLREKDFIVPAEGISKNGIIKDTYDSLYFETGKQILVHVHGEVLCEPVIMPFGPTSGPQVLCQYDTVVYRTVSGRSTYAWGYIKPDGITGATLNVIDNAYNRDSLVVVMPKAGKYQVWSQYTNTDGIRLGREYIEVQVNPRPFLQLTGKADTTICEGTQIDLSQMVRDTVSGNNTTFYYAVKEGNGTFTPVSNMVEPWDSTTYRITATVGETGCDALNYVEFRVNINRMPSIDVQKIVSQPDCNNSAGSILLNVSGGSGTYLYSKDNGATYSRIPADNTIAGLTAGTYTIYVRDSLRKGCNPSMGEPITINAYTSGLSVQATPTDASNCTDENGRILLVPNGGIMPYQYTLNGVAVTPVNGEISGLKAGTYIVSVKGADGCLASASTTIKAAGGVTAVLEEIASADCNEPGLLRITASNGKEPYSYKITNEGWTLMNSNPDSVRLEAKTYTVYVKDSTGCETADSITIRNINGPSVTLNAIINPVCNATTGGSISFTATGGSGGLYYKIGNGLPVHIIDPQGKVTVSGLAVGSYQITVIDNDGFGCTTALNNITIEKDPDFIQAVDDYATTYINQPVSGNLLANDFDLNNGTFKLLSTTTLQHGTFTSIQPDGRFTYKPQDGYTGKDSVQYIVQNACGLISNAWLHLTILHDSIPANRPPVAMVDNYITTVNKSITTSDVRNNDIDPDGDNLTNPVLVSTTSRGTLTNHHDGTFTYKPDTNFVGVDKFVYQICDDKGLCDTAVVFLTVLSDTVAQKFVTAIPDAYTVAKFDTLKIAVPGVKINDIYPSNEEPVTVTRVLSSGTLHGALTLNTDGSFTYVPDLHYYGPDVFVYKLCTNDPGTPCDSTIVNILVTQGICPDSVVLIAADTLEICQGDSVNLNVAIDFVNSQYIDTVYFFSDQGFVTDITANPVVKTQGWYYVQADNIYECSVYDSIFVKVNPLPAVTVSLSNKDTLVCSNTSVAFDLRRMVVTPADSLVFSENKSFSPFISDITAYQVTSNKTVKLYVKAVNKTTGCETPAIGYDSLYIQVNRYGLASDITASDDTVCYNTPATLVAISSVGNDIRWYANADRTGLLTMNDTLITGNLNRDTIFYVSIQSDTICENEAGNLKAVKVKINQYATASLLNTKDTIICTDNAILLNVSSTGVINPVYTWYSDSLTITSISTGVSYTTPVLTVANPNDTVYKYFVSVKGLNYCENIAENRKAIKVKVEQIPTLQIVTPIDTLGICYNVNPITLISRTTGNITWRGWYDNNNVANNETKFFGSYDGITWTTDTVTYRIEQSEAGQDIRLFARVRTQACTYVADSIHIQILPYMTGSSLELITQPLSYQNTCSDTVYELKVKATEDGDLTDIKVRLNDTRKTNLLIKDAHYKHPYDASGWTSLGVPVSTDTTGKTWGMPSGFILSKGDSLQVQVTVAGQCGFTSGGTADFLLNSRTVCGDSIPQKKVETRGFYTQQDTAHVNRYTIFSQMLPDTIVTNNTGDTVTWRLTAIVDGDQLTDSTRETMTVFIPSGLVPVHLSYKPIKNAPADESSLKPKLTSAGIEFTMPIVSGLKDEDSIVVELKFLANKALCQEYPLYSEIWFNDTIKCGEDTCVSHSIRGGIYPKLTVERYMFELTDTIIGKTVAGLWYGEIRVKANTQFYAGDSIHVDFYIDRDSSSTITAKDTLVREHIYVTKNVALGGSFIDSITEGIYIEQGKQLLALIEKGAYLCDSAVFPIAVIMGEDTICQYDTVMYYAVEGMKDYSWGTDAVSGATPKAIPVIEGTQISDMPHVRRLTFPKSGNFTIWSQYTTNTNMRVGKTYFDVRVNARPFMALTADTDTTVCNATIVELTHFFRDTVSESNSTIRYYTKDGSGHFTQEVTNTNVTPSDTTVYRATAIAGGSGCESVNYVDFQINVNPLPVVAVMTKDTSVCSDIPVPFDLTALAVQTYGNQFEYNTNKNFTGADVFSPIMLAADKDSVIYVRSYNTLTGCTGVVIDSIKLHVHNLPDVHVTLTGKDSAICSDLPVVFNLKAMVDNREDSLVFSKQHDFSSFISTNLNAYEVAVNTTDTLYVKAVNKVTGCETPDTEFDTLHITVNGLPMVSARNTARDTSVCSDQSIVFNLKNMVVVSGGDSLQFSSSKSFEPLVSSAASFNVAVDADALIYVRVLNTATGCLTKNSEIDSLSMSVHNLPDVSVILPGGKKDTVVNSPVAVTFDLLNMVSYTGDSVVFISMQRGESISGDTLSHYVMAIETRDTFYIKSVNSITGCETPVFEYDTLMVEVKALPVVDVLVGDTAVCSSNEEEMFNLTLMACKGINCDSVQFCKDTLFNNIFSTTEVEAYQVKTNLLDTVYVRGYNTVNNLVSSGCQMLVLGVNPNPAAAFSHTQDPSNAFVIDFKNLSSVSSPDSLSYEWNFGDENSPTNISTQKDPKHAFSRTGKFDVTLTIHCVPSGCIDEVIYTVYAGYTIEGGFGVNQKAQCSEGNTFIFTNLTKSVGTQVEYSWDFGDGTSSLEKEPVHRYADSGTYEVKLYVSSTDISNPVKDTFEMTVYVVKTPTVTNAQNFEYCHNERAEVFYFTGDVVGTVYKWHRLLGQDVDSTGLSQTSGIDSIPGFLATNDGGISHLVSAYRVMPEYSQYGFTCPGQSVNYLITVNPQTTVSSLSEQIYCAESEVSAYKFTGNNTTNTTYRWQHIGGDTLKGFPLSGTDELPKFRAHNDSLRMLTASYAVVPAYTYANKYCGGVGDTFTLRVAAKATLSSSKQLTKQCSGTGFNYVPTSETQGVLYSWERLPNASIVEASVGGSDSITNDVLTNQSTLVTNVRYRITLHTGSSCSYEEYIEVPVLPSISLTAPLLSDTICSGSRFEYIATANMPSLRYEWTRSAREGINNGAGSSGHTALISETLVNSTTSPITVHYQLQISNRDCIHYDTLTVVVKPSSTISLLSTTLEVCPGETSSLLRLSNDHPELPTYYKLVYPERSESYGFQSMSSYALLTGDSIRILLPDDLPSQHYTGHLYIESNGCVHGAPYTYSIHMGQRTQILVQPVSEVILCEEGESTLRLSVEAAGTNLSYQWYHEGEAIEGATSSTYENPSVSSSDYGDYTVEVTGNCGRVISNPSSVHLNEVLIFQKWDDVLFVSRRDTGTGEKLEYASYQWYKVKDGKNIPLSEKSTYQYYTEPGLSGTFTVEVIFADGSRQMSCPYTLVSGSRFAYKVYPNPSTGRETLTVYYDNGEENLEGATLTICDAFGRQLRTEPLHKRTTSMQINLPSGVYIFRVKDSTGRINNEKVIINN